MKSLPCRPNPAIDTWRPLPGVPKATFWFRLWRWGFEAWVSGLCTARIYNRHYEPASGSVLYISNHQSYLDPPLMSMSLQRPVNYMARDTLFHSRIFGPLIYSFGAFPVKRGTADTGALKEAIRRLKAGGQLVLFAEGTRTRDGRVGPFLPGVALLAQKAADWIVPVTIEGAFEAWPRTSPLPGPGGISVMYAPPIPREEARKVGGAEFLASVRRTIIDMQGQLRIRRGKQPLVYPET
jgi:1-acyl-sn-glycerol-3-phosphate acyltransferase